MQIELIQKRLLEVNPIKIGNNGPWRMGAVAAILRPNGNDTDILLIKRAERRGDPWSGHMALPGGHSEPEDKDTFATAVRETKEEIGMDLSSNGTLIGQLDDLNVNAYGKPTNLIIIPYVFLLGSVPKFQLNEEVTEIVWGPLGRMSRGEIDTTREYRLEGYSLDLPAYNVNDRIVWGLTYKILQNLFSKIHPVKD